jgi:hypothetical protein
VPLHLMTAARSAPVVFTVLRPDRKVNVGGPAKRYAHHARADHARVNHELSAAAGTLRTYAPPSRPPTAWSSGTAPCATRATAARAMYSRASLDVRRPAAKELLTRVKTRSYKRNH